MNMQIHCDYPGGNIKVSEMGDSVVKLEQDIRDTTQWWFYWNFCIENAQGKEMVFEFTNGEVVGPWGPAVSKDGRRWDWLGKDSLVSRKSFKYTFGTDDKKVFFCFSLPYQVSDFEGFLDTHKDNPLLAREILTSSEQGRAVPLIKIGNANAQKHVVFTCRHHACESTASYLLEGLMQYLLENKELDIFDQYLFHVIPFIDIDGVENGDQGKSRFPHDHNRDYTANPIYRVTGSVMRYLNSLNMVAALDFHSPYKWGGRNDYPFIVKKISPVKEELECFGRLLEEVTEVRKESGGIVYSSKMDIEANEDWNSMEHPAFANYFAKNGIKLCSTFEFPYFGTEDMVFTQSKCKEFGFDVAKALNRYLWQILSV